MSVIFLADLQTHKQLLLMTFNIIFETQIHSKYSVSCVFLFSYGLCLVLGPAVLPPGSVQFYTQTGQVIQLLKVETLLKAAHKAVLRVQAETHGPQYLSAVLTEVVEGLHELIQVRMRIHHVSCQNVVKTMCSTRETLSHVLTPDELHDLERVIKPIKQLIAKNAFFTMSSKLYFICTKISE